MFQKFSIVHACRYKCIKYGGHSIETEKTDAPWHASYCLVTIYNFLDAVFAKHNYAYLRQLCRLNLTKLFSSKSKTADKLQF